ncbi:MAG: hypothetical protein C4346_12105 [Chloroflexota bacterium]
MVLSAYRVRLRSVSTRLPVPVALALAPGWMRFPFDRAILASIAQGGTTDGGQRLPWISVAPALQTWGRGRSPEGSPSARSKAEARRQ